MDERAVKETISMMLDEKHMQISYLPLMSGIDSGDFCYSVYAGEKTPSKKIEELSSKWDEELATLNKGVEEFKAGKK